MDFFADANFLELACASVGVLDPASDGVLVVADDGTSVAVRDTGRGGAERISFLYGKDMMRQNWGKLDDNRRQR